MAVVCAISFVASFASYFLAAVIPWEVLPTEVSSFTFGILGGAVLMLAIAGICIASKDKVNIFKLYPWLLVFEIVTFSLFLADKALYFPAFVAAVGISSIFEILLIMYFGILMSKGYSTPAMAFSFSGGCVRAGIAFGNTLAVAYEHAPAVAQAVTPETCLALICVLAALLIPLVRQEFSIVALTAAPPSKAEVDAELRRGGRGVLAVGTRARDPRAHRARLHHQHHLHEAGDIALHGEHPHPPHLREDADPQAQRAAELHQPAEERLLG